ncbi:MAG: DUF4012 domain-containing protein [Chloroflexi bacterium]|nr:DUF4012 domain-containing protein [Chloroflexota bacterium]
MVKPHRVRNFIFFIISVASILWADALFYFTIHLVEESSVYTSVNSTNMFSVTEFNTWGSHLPVLDRDLQILRRLSWPLTPVFKVANSLPGIGKSLGQVPILLHFSANLAEAGHLVYTNLSPILAMTQAETLNEDYLQQIYRVLSEARPEISRAAEALANARAIRPQIETAQLPHQLGDAIQQFDEQYTEIQQGLQILMLIPDLLGSEEQPRAYLVLAQNRDELRATGGFISGIGIAEFAAGDIVNLTMQDSYAVDDFAKNYPPPPDALHQFMLAGLWLPRDANWSPDFPTAARSAQDLYTLSTSQATHGVIAVDQEAVKMLLNHLGELDLAAFSETVTAENVEYLMQQAWADSPDAALSQEWWQHRKDFMPQLGGALAENFLALRDVEKLLNIGRAALESLKAGHILIYVNQPEIQNALAKIGLDHSVHPGEGDFLYLVDSNVSFNKTDAVIQRQITYLVNFSNPEMIPAMLIVKYTHNGTQAVACVHQADYGSGVYADMQARCYWDYWRAYIAPDTAVIGTNSTPVSGTWLLSGEDWAGEVSSGTGEGNAQMLSGFFVLPSAQNQDIVLELVLNPRILQRYVAGTLSYSLRVQKQAGLLTLPLVLQIKPPSGYQITKPETGWAQDSESGFWVWSGDMMGTQEFEITFEAIQEFP